MVPNQGGHAYVAGEAVSRTQSPHHPPSSSLSLAFPLQSQKGMKGAEAKPVAQRKLRQKLWKDAPLKSQVQTWVGKEQVLPSQRLCPPTTHLGELTLFYLKYLICLDLFIYSKFLLWKC